MGSIPTRGDEIIYHFNIFRLRGERVVEFHHSPHNASRITHNVGNERILVGFLLIMLCDTGYGIQREAKKTKFPRESGTNVDPFSQSFTFIILVK